MPWIVSGRAELARITGVRSVEANSWWCPGHTMRIVFEPAVAVANSKDVA